jgi:hypothetical protein
MVTIAASERNLPETIVHIEDITIRTNFLCAVFHSGDPGTALAVRSRHG